MPAYKYTLKSGKTLWYASFYYTDWMGNYKRVVKRGFKTQREAKAYEDEFLSKTSEKSDILFSALVSNYLEDMSHRLKESTLQTKRYIIDLKILPYFKDMKICDIDSVKIRKWQNVLLDQRDENGKRYSATYVRSIHNQLSAIMNYAVKHYGLRINPCHLTGTIGEQKAEEMNIWTKEQFEQFVEQVHSSRMRIAFEILFYSGMREGELLALFPSDFIEPNIIDIKKNYVVLKGGSERITKPKTPKSKRKVTIPESLFKEIQEYISLLYGIGPDDRIFEFKKQALYNNMKAASKRAGLPKIRIHDLRHSNASMLINAGVDIMEISRRLGHESTKTTWDTYGHLYPDKEAALGKFLEDLRSGDTKKNGKADNEDPENDTENS